VCLVGFFGGVGVWVSFCVFGFGVLCVLLAVEWGGWLGEMGLWWGLVLFGFGVSLWVVMWGWIFSVGGGGGVGVGGVVGVCVGWVGCEGVCFFLIGVWVQV